MLKESYLRREWHSGSSADKLTHILIFQLTRPLFSRHMITQQASIKMQL